MNTKMKEVAEKAIAFQRDCVKDKNGSMAHGVLHMDDGTVNVYAFDGEFMSSWQMKNLVAGMIIKELKTHGGTFAFCSDAWSAQLPEGKKREDMPNSLADWPEEYRREVIICAVNRIGEQGISAFQFYKRDGEKIITEDIHWDEKPVGRFIFDLTGDKINSAMTEALLKTSEGFSGAQ